ncbi:RING finger protein 150-like isoform X2 [Lineus longissimus]|uniref:RING finger protein 150-like isoform X2 n=1 Tax=Lineus longissimus TaxID=88925 RepID=UPI00315CFD55
MEGVGITVVNTLTMSGRSNPNSVSRWWTVILLGAMFLCGEGFGDEFSTELQSYYTAWVNITFKDVKTGRIITERGEIGRYGTNSKIAAESGVVVHVRHGPGGNTTNGCARPENAIPNEKWVALVQRGTCKFHEKIHNVAKKRNASAVIIYDYEDGNDLITMEHDVDDVVSIFISKKYGERIAQLVENKTKVMVYITVGTHTTHHFTSINKTSVLFVSISFIVLMIISLAWLVFYYIQRFRYAHAKERLSRRLANAAKKAITKIPLRTIKCGDKETQSDFDQCAVCIEGYKQAEVVRILPCKHVFHKSCVDPWLLEQRSCPMCKMDILKAYGFHISGSQESVANPDSGNQGDIEIPNSPALVENTAVHIFPTNDHDMRPCNGHSVQVLHLQPPDIECHTETDRTARNHSSNCIALVEPDVSEGSRSSDSDYNERHSLMEASRREIEQETCGI